MPKPLKDFLLGFAVFLVLMLLSVIALMYMVYVAEIGESDEGGWAHAVSVGCRAGQHSNVVDLLGVNYDGSQ